MKPILSVLLLCGAAAISGRAQSVPSEPTAPAGPVSSAAAIAAIPVTPDGYAVTEIGDNHRRWTRVVAVPDDSGNLVYKTNTYMELLPGGSYYVRQGPNGPEWAESKAEIEACPGGAVARRCANPMIFANNLATEGAIDVQTPAGRFRSQVVGLCYADGAVPTNIWIAVVTNCQGEITAPNQVLYPAALAGDGWTASVRYTLRLDGWDQDVLIPDPGSLIAPESCGLDSRSPTLTLQVISEFIDPPTPEQTPRVVRAADGTAFEDEEVDWGQIRLGQGRAFVLGQSNGGISVTKHWMEIESRHVLVEEVPFSVLKKALLGKNQGASLGPRPNPHRRLASLKGLPVLPPAKRDSKPMQLALGKSPGAGLTIDYTTITTSQSNYVFASDTTYYISGASAVSLAGCTTIEGSTVIKFTNCPTAGLSLNGPLVCTAGPYNMALLTSRNDNTVGQNITGSTGNPSSTNGATYLDAAAAQTNAYKWLRFSYAGKALHGVSFKNGVWHSQFINCGTAVESTGSDPAPLRNVLIAQCTNGVVTTGSFTGEHLTVDQCATLLSGSGSSATLTNCLLTAVTTTGTISASEGTSQFTSGSSLYLAVGAGNYYLGAWTNNGSTNLNPQLLADLKSLTTDPPIPLTGTINSNTTLWPQAQRETGTQIPGYAYPALDYLVSNLTLCATLTLTNGVAIGLCGSGFCFPDAESGGNGALTSFGLPRPLNVLARARNVQEQALAVDGSVLFTLNTCLPTLKLRFTDIALAQGGRGTLLPVYFPQYSFGTLWLRDCLVYGAVITVYANAANNSSAMLTNNLLDRCALTLAETSWEDSYFSLTMYNNLLRAGTLDLYYWDGAEPPWYVQNNLLDRCVNSKTDDDGFITCGYNSFTTNTVNNLGGSNNKVNLVADYQTGPLGAYYYPTNGGSYSLTNLINAGSTWATNVGLYHFTTTTNQVKEGTTKLDMGFHFVAVDANGNPVDTDGDGIPDYLEDANGDGNGANDPTSWLIYNSRNGLTGTKPFEIFTPLH